MISFFYGLLIVRTNTAGWITDQWEDFFELLLARLDLSRHQFHEKIQLRYKDLLNGIIIWETTAELIYLITALIVFSVFHWLIDA
ncbi:MAG: hypothetical protein ACXAB2_15600 [Candidatus Hodarchaeales archaeon]